MLPPATLGPIRFGLGLPDAGTAGDPAAMLAALAGPDAMRARHPGPGTDAALPAVLAAEAARAARRRAGEDAAAQAALAAARRRVRDLVEAGMLAALARAADAADAFRERLLRFWTDHFTVRARSGLAGPLVFAFAEDAIRPHLAGRFADMLQAAILHPAMLLYLDQTASVGPGSRAGLRRGRGLNENLARELIELHTLGAGAAYGQTDVRELAELLTGLDIGPAGTRFRPERAEPGAETVLGRRYAGEGLAPVRAALADLAARPETAAHLARKLAVHFVADDPDPGLVAALAAAWRDGGGALRPVYAALLGHPAAWAPPLAKARQPWDFVVAALRGLGLDGAALRRMGAANLRRRLIEPMAGMGQPWAAPPGPDGWPEPAAAWITPQGLAARVEWAMTVPARLVPDLPEPADFARRALGDLADPTLLRAAARAETRREGLGLVLASPAFNRR
jgi:uncharacterized protein (DUF1800 family)